MKLVFYKRLIADKCGLTANERIVYSFLVYRSICDYEYAWNPTDGTFDDVAIKECGEYIDLPFCCLKNDNFACTRVAKILNIDKSTVSRSVQKLKFLGIIDISQKTIRHNELFMDGYFEINCEKLKGELCIFYYWLKDLKGDNQYIYANRLKLSSMYYSELQDIRWYLHKLKELGYIERQSDGKLLIK